ncbi:hypothetical protein TNCV_2104711 [Trichonephila clavipes]|nr:hypothetical protein TNCV_2104711 [Trichonephila clavipes]
MKTQMCPIRLGSTELGVQDIKLGKQTPHKGVPDPQLLSDSLQLSRFLLPEVIPENVLQSIIPPSPVCVHGDSNCSAANTVISGSTIDVRNEES